MSAYSGPRRHRRGNISASRRTAVTRWLNTPTILIIRHAEKPLRLWPGPGLTAAGDPDAQSLVIRGWQRAGAWAALFGTGLSRKDYPIPSKIYAANPSAKPDDEADDEPSQRPFETVIPLAAHLGTEPPDTTYAVGQEIQLATTVVAQTGVVLIAWEHKAIAHTLLPAISKRLPGFPDDQKPPQMPKKWEGTRFDVVLRFDIPAPPAPWSFQQLCPCLLAGDSATPMP